jgi:RHS repeat-associated protein
VNGSTTLFAQTFTYDAFGNIKKSGSATFNPSYTFTNSVTTNQFSSLPGVSVSYDANGNLLTDNLNSYTWDPNWGNMVSVSTGTSTVTVTYDALGRMVEQYNGSAYVQILYSAIGKTALMSGSTLIKAFIPLPGLGMAIYNSSSGSPVSYRHADWLGSSRLTSTAARGMSSSMAYAPFGEQYSVSDTADPSFTGQNSDTVVSLYDFTFRENSPSQGRWISPDPAGLTAVDPTNPQTWNRYAYVANNPLTMVDPSGLFYVCVNGVQYEGLYVAVDGQVQGVEFYFVGFCSSESGGPFVGGSGGGGDGGGGGGGSGGGTAGGQTVANNSSKSKCVQPTLAQSAVISLLSAAAAAYGGTITIGYGGSAGAGRGVGTSSTYSWQLAVSPNGQAAFIGTSSNPVAYPFNSVTSAGAGIYGGTLVGFSNAQTPQDLGGPFLNYGGGGGEGLAMGGDLAFGAGTQGQTVLQGTLTLGFGAGGFAHGLSPTTTSVLPICQ